MAYQEGFVASVIVNGKPLREINESNERTVRLKFDSEYKIRLKNNHNVRAFAKVLIDGTEILMGKLIMQPYGTIDLERFVVDGNLNKGKKFKFVSAGHSEVQDPTSKENGLIEIVFEKEDPPSFDWCTSTCTTTVTAASIPVHQTAFTTTGGILRGTAVGGSTFSNNYNAHHNLDMNMSQTDLGATVEGGNSNQQFQEVNTNFNTTAPITIHIRMKGITSTRPWIINCKGVETVITHDGHIVGRLSGYEVTPTHVMFKIPKECVSFE